MKLFLICGLLYCIVNARNLHKNGHIRKTRDDTASLRIKRSKLANEMDSHAGDVTGGKHGLHLVGSQASAGLTHLAAGAQTRKRRGTDAKTGAATLAGAAAKEANSVETNDESKKKDKKSDSVSDKNKMALEQKVLNFTTVAPLTIISTNATKQYQNNTKIGNTTTQPPMITNITTTLKPPQQKQNVTMLPSVNTTVRGEIITLVTTAPILATNSSSVPSPAVNITNVTTSARPVTTARPLPQTTLPMINVTDTMVSAGLNQTAAVTSPHVTTAPKQLNKTQNVTGAMPTTTPSATNHTTAKPTQSITTTQQTSIAQNKTSSLANSTAPTFKLESNATTQAPFLNQTIAATNAPNTSATSSQRPDVTSSAPSTTASPSNNTAIILGTLVTLGVIILLIGIAFGCSRRQERLKETNLRIYLLKRAKERQYFDEGQSDL